MSFSPKEILNLSGILIKQDACIIIVRTEWNAHVVDKLEEGCIKVFEANKIKYKIISVPGAFEIVFAIKSYWENYKEIEKPDSFIALGCVIKGDTPHFDYVCKAVTDGVVQLNLSLPVPVIFGVLTVNDQLQAEERIGGKHGHKGEEAATSALKMVALNQSLIPS